MNTLYVVITAWLYLLAVYLFILVLVQSIIAVLSVLNLFQKEKGDFAENAHPAIAVVVAAHNEEYTLPVTLDGLISQTAPPSQLVVVNDSSTDRTHAAAEEFISRNELANGKVLTTHRGGMGKALQRGLDEVDTPLTCFVNADVEIDSNALARLRRHFVDPAVVAMSVWVWPLIPKRKGLMTSALVLLQVIEYARAILWRPGWEKLGALSIIEGRLGMFRTGVLRETQTLRTTPSAIDYALTLEIHRQCSEKRMPYKIGIETKATVWTDVPLNFKTLFAQRMRYASGFFRAYALNRSMMWQQKYGALGLFELPVRVFTSFFATVEFLLWATCILLSLAGHSLATTAWTILLAYLSIVTFQLYLSLALSRRFTVYRWPASFDRLLWLIVPFAAMVWEPIKGLANLAGWIKMPWRHGPWMPLRHNQPLFSQSNRDQQISPTRL